MTDHKNDPKGLNPLDPSTPIDRAEQLVEKLGRERPVHRTPPAGVLLAQNARLKREYSALEARFDQLRAEQRDLLSRLKESRLRFPEFARDLDRLLSEIYQFGSGIAPEVTTEIIHNLGEEILSGVKIKRDKWKRTMTEVLIGLLADQPDPHRTMTAGVAPDLAYMQRALRLILNNMAMTSDYGSPVPSDAKSTQTPN